MQHSKRVCPIDLYNGIIFSALYPFLSSCSLTSNFQSWLPLSIEFEKMSLLSCLSTMTPRSEKFTTNSHLIRLQEQFNVHIPKQMTPEKEAEFNLPMDWSEILLCIPQDPETGVHLFILHSTHWLITSTILFVPLGAPLYGTFILQAGCLFYLLFPYHLLLIPN